METHSQTVSAAPSLDYGGWPSPFDSTGVQYVWDSVSLGLLKTCPRKYQLSMILNWQPKTHSHHLDFGIFYHSAIEFYVKEIIKRERAIAKGYGEPIWSKEDWHNICVRHAIRKAMIDSWGYEPGIDKRTGLPKTDKTRRNLIRSLVWYFEQYGIDDPCKPFLLSNGQAAAELSFRFEVGNDQMLAGHLDQIVWFGEHRYVLDHKTTSSTVTGASAKYYFSGFNPDNQMSLYAIGAAVAFNTPVQGVIIDATQVAVGFTAFGRDFTHRSKDQLTEFLEGVYSYRRLAEEFTRTGFWPMNETACGNYGGCAFRDVCSKSAFVRERFLRTDFTQDKPWNPLEPR